MELKTSSSFKTTGLLQPWQTLCKMFSKCLTTRVTGWDQPPLQIMQMMYCFVNNIHVDYAKLLWEGLYYSLYHPTSSIPYPRFTKIIVSHYMTIFPEISRRARDMYHNLQDDDIMKNIFNSGRHKDKVGMQILDWMITEEMKHTKHYGVPVPNVEKADEIILQDTLQVSLAETQSGEVQEARENVELVNKHLASEEIEKLVEGSENVIDDSLPPRNDEPQILGTRLEPRSDKESTEVERTNDEEVKLRNQVLVYVAEGLILERQKTKEEMERMIAKAILQERGNIQAEISLQIQKAIDNQIPSQVDASVRSYMSGHILHVHPVQSQTQSVPEQQYQLYLFMKNDPQLQQQDIAIWLALQMKFENLQVQQTTCRPSAVRPRDQDDPHDDAHPEGENSAKRQKTSEYEAYVSGESSSGQVNEEERGPSTSGNQEQEDDYDFWTDSYASDDDEIPSEQVSQDIMEEVSLTIDEAKLKKMADEMLRQRLERISCFTIHEKGDLHLSFNSYSKGDPEAPALSLINQDLLYLKKGSSGLEKIVLSLNKFLAIIFNDDDIEEQTSR
ncbi:hypothetical protein Tco_0856333 [Tanacetum coccineum]|uniref:Uncharacterized protein n=1 Tax=Tanacetum coccineum TaxID=301880 RepID=A0ABQ5B322_9ASTR